MLTLSRIKPSAPILKRAAIAALIGLMSAHSQAATLPPLVDDFSDPVLNSMGNQRQFLTDTVAGGKSSLITQSQRGVLAVSGNITPARGQLGWASTVLLLNPTGQAEDASAYDGISIGMKKGALSLSANSNEVTNFDYHAAPILVKPDGNFYQLKIPFTSMKRAWSEQTPLNPATISSISLVAYGMQPGDYAYAIDDMRFYTKDE